MQLVVNISDSQSSSSPEDVLVTYSLGSCIGVAAWDPVAKVGGLLHYQLPCSTMDPERARQRPAMFADTGMGALLASMESQGAVRRRVRVKLAGGAEMLDDAGVFRIGRRNHAAIRKLLWKEGLLLDAEDVGGAAPRTLSLRVADGAVTVKSNQRTREI